MLPLELAGMSDAAATAERFLGEVGLENRLNHYPPHYRVVSSNESPSPGQLRANPASFSPMSQRAIWIPERVSE